MWAPYSSQIPTPGYGHAQLEKIANGNGGGAYAAGSSLYFGGYIGGPNIFGGTLAVVDYTPLQDLKTLAFQIEISEPDGYDFYNAIMPQLSIEYSGGVHTFSAATRSELLDSADNGSAPEAGGSADVLVNLYGMQWDLSAYTNISKITISFDAVMHASIYGIQLDQSTHAYGNEFVFTVVPEPAAYALMLVGAALAVTVVRRRRSRRS